MTTQTKDEINCLFVDSCKTGDLNETIRLLNLGADVRYTKDSPFRWSCEMGHLETAKWLHSLGADIHVQNDYAFGKSCRNGHFETAKWLHSLGADIHAINDYAFRKSCSGGHFEISKWLHSLGVDIHAENDYAFRWSCYSEKLETVKWLHSLCADSYTENEYLLKWCRDNKTTETGKWLIDLIDSKEESGSLQNEHVLAKEMITVKISSGTDLFYTVDDIQYSIKLVEPIAYNINECTVKIESVTYNLVSTFSDNPCKYNINEECNLLLEEGTIINQNGILTKLVCATNFTLNKTFNAKLPKGTKLQTGSVHFKLQNEVECFCKYA